MALTNQRFRHLTFIYFATKCFSQDQRWPKTNLAHDVCEFDAADVKDKG